MLGEVSGRHGAHGTAVVADTGHGFATSGNDQSVVMFDLKTFKVLGRIPAAEDADAIIYDDASNRVFTFNGDAHSSTVIDPRAGKADHEHRARRQARVRRVGGRRQGLRESHGHERESWRSTRRRATVLRRWSTAPCKQPVAMAIDTAHHRLFSGCRSGVMAVSDYVRPARWWPRFPSAPGSTAPDSMRASSNAFASNADGTLTVIHQDTPDQYHVVENVQTPPASRNMGLDPTTHRLFVASAQFGPVPQGGRAEAPCCPIPSRCWSSSQRSPDFRPLGRGTLVSD